MSQEEEWEEGQVSEAMTRMRGEGKQEMKLIPRLEN
jgi:hypothetical protein